MSVDADAETRAEHRASDHDRADEHAEEECRPAPGWEAADFPAHDLPFVSCAVETTPPRCLSPI